MESLERLLAATATSFDGLLVVDLTLLEKDVFNTLKRNGFLETRPTQKNNQNEIVLSEKTRKIIHEGVR